jgi:hypothetical protein
MIAMMRPSMTVSVIIASGGLAFRPPGSEPGLEDIFGSYPARLPCPGRK